MTKSWIEKLHKKDLPKIVELDEKLSRRYKGARTMVIPSPEEVMQIMGRVPRGALISVSEIRKILAHKHGTDTTCPLTTGIFIWIAANASREMVEKGLANKEIPFWRTLKSKGELVEKYPGGTEYQKSKLEEEGHRVIQKGKKWVVENFSNNIVHPEFFME